MRTFREFKVCPLPDFRAVILISTCSRQSRGPQSQHCLHSRVAGKALPLHLFVT